MLEALELGRQPIDLALEESGERLPRLDLRGSAAGTRREQGVDDLLDPPALGIVAGLPLDALTWLGLGLAAAVGGIE